MVQIRLREQKMKLMPGGQSDFFKDWENRVLFLEGGWGSGKTFIGSRKLLHLHLYNAFNVYGDATYVPSAIVGPTYRNMKDVMYPALREAAEQMGLSIVYRNADASFEFPQLGTKRMPSLIIARSAERPELITGWEVGAIWGDEAARWRRDDMDPKQDAYLQLTARLRHPLSRLRQMLLTYTNEGDRTRVYEEAHGGNPAYGCYRARTKDNHRMKTFYKKQRELLTQELAEQYLEGDALRRSFSMVYPGFEANVHVDESLCVDPMRPIQISLDFNIQPGMHGLIGQHDAAQDELTVVHEITGPGMSLRDWLKQFHEWWNASGYGIEQCVEVYGDATGQGRWSGTGQSHYQLIQEYLGVMGIRYEMRTPRSNPSVEDRVNTMNLAMRDLHGRTHWRCHPRCKRLIADLQLMRRDERGGVDKSDPKLSHASDAEGYRVWRLRPIRRVDVKPGRMNV